jgi:hypothetical protein
LPFETKPQQEKIMKTKILGIVLASGVLVAGCSKTPGDIYVSQQTKSAKAGNHWAEFELWQAYAEGAHDVNPNPARADKWLRQFVKDVYVVRFAPAGNFHPQNAADYLNDINRRTPEVRSDNRRIGVSGFLRTTKDGDKLAASFLTNEPDKLRAFIEINPDLKFISVELLTPEKFIEYERSRQESL